VSHFTSFLTLPNSYRILAIPPFASVANGTLNYGGSTAGNRPEVPDWRGYPHKKLSEGRSDASGLICHIHLDACATADGPRRMYCKHAFDGGGR